MAPLRLLVFLLLAPLWASANNDFRLPIHMNGSGMGSHMITKCVFSGEEKECVLDTGATLTALKEFPKDYTPKGQIEDFGFSGVKEVCSLIEVPELKVGNLLKTNQTVMVCPNLPFNLIGLDFIQIKGSVLVLDLRDPQNGFIGYSDRLPGKDIHKFDWLSEDSILRKLILLKGIHLGPREVENSFFDSGADSIFDLDYVEKHPNEFRKMQMIGGSDMAGQNLKQYMILAPSVSVDTMKIADDSMSIGMSLSNVGATDAKVEFLLGQNMIIRKIWGFDFENNEWFVGEDQVACVTRSMPLCPSGSKNITDGYGCNYQVCK